jgi:hypothetical protein
MPTFAILMAAALAVAPAAAQAPYQPPANRADPAAHLAEMLALYDEVCLHVFPDDDAVARNLRARGAVRLSEPQVRIYLRDDPGRGWRLEGRSGRFDLTIEDPPFHACTVRTMTASGFPSLQPYQDLAARFEAGRGFRPVQRIDGEMENVMMSIGGEQAILPNGSGEALLVAIGTPTDKYRSRGETAVEVRFVHQFSPRQDR